MKQLYFIVLVLAIFHDVCIQQTASRSHNQKLIQISEMCCFMGKFRQGLIPDPFFCNNFSQCRPLMNPDGNYSLDPISQPCKGGLLYDFRQCKCLHPNEVECFNTSPDHTQFDFFNCTTEFREEGIDNTCGRGSS